MAEELVYMTHEGTKGVGGPVPRHAFDAYWKDKGWQETEVTFRENDQGQSVPMPKRSRTAAESKGK